MKRPKRKRPKRILLIAISLLAPVACASRPPSAGSQPKAGVEAQGLPGATPNLALDGTPDRNENRAPASSARRGAARTALSMLGVPYRYGGASPNGFDCSGLVVYSYAAAGLTGLPHSAVALERRSSPVELAALEAGDLLFFDLDGAKTAHVGIYLGDETFVHAPSPGKHVERVRFDHLYWGSRIQRAGRVPEKAR